MGVCVTWPLPKALQPVCVKRRTGCALTWPGDWQRVTPFVYQCNELGALPAVKMHVGLRLCRN